VLQIRLLRACQDTLCVCHSEDYNIHTFTFKEVQEDFPPTPEQDPIGSPGYHVWIFLLTMVAVMSMVIVIFAVAEVDLEQQRRSKQCLAP
jgi:hypothetical protein